MRYFKLMSVFYIVLVKRSNEIFEVSGVISADSLDIASTYLSNMGLAVREVREATPQEINVHRLKKLRDKLGGDKRKIRIEPILSEEPIKKTSGVLILLVVVIFLVVLRFWLKG